MNGRVNYLDRMTNVFSPCQNPPVFPFGKIPPPPPFANGGKGGFRRTEDLGEEHSG